MWAWGSFHWLSPPKKNESPSLCNPTINSSNGVGHWEPLLPPYFVVFLPLLWVILNVLLPISCFLVLDSHDYCLILDSSQGSWNKVKPQMWHYRCDYFCLPEDTVLGIRMLSCSTENIRIWGEDAVWQRSEVLCDLDIIAVFLPRMQFLW